MEEQNQCSPGTPTPALGFGVGEPPGGSVPHTTPSWASTRVGNEIGQLYRRGMLGEAVVKAREADPSLHPRGVMTGVQALMETGKFRDAIAFGNASMVQCAGPAAECLKTLVCYAAMMERPGKAARERLRRQLAIVGGCDDGFSRAFADRWEARLRAYEITVFVRPITDMHGVVDRLMAASKRFRELGFVEEAWGELLRAAELLRDFPFCDGARAAGILESVKRDASGSGPAPAAARASLALAEIGFDAAMRGGEPPEKEVLLKALSAFDDTMELFRRAGMPAGEADVRAAAGRKLMWYGNAAGVSELRQAAGIWEREGHRGAADGAWRDLSMWHDQRGERDQVEAIEGKLGGEPLVESRLTATTGGAQEARGAMTRGDFAQALEIIEAALVPDLEPGEAATLLLMKSAVLGGKGAASDSRRAALEAVEWLRPAAPCKLLGDALFQYGSQQESPVAMWRLWEDAALADLACGLNRSAAQRYANIAESLSQTGAVLPDGRDPEALFQRAIALLDQEPGMEAQVERGNVSQRRGLVAFRRGDFAACGRHLSEAEACFRRTGRNADLAFTLGHEGLVLYQIGRARRALEPLQTAMQRFAAAADGFRRQDLLGEQLRMERIAGAVAWEAGELASGPDRDVYFVSAEQHMATAADLMEVLRRGRQEQNLFARQSSLENLGTLMEPFLDEAFRFQLVVRRNPSHALGWLEKGKARGLLDAIGSNPIPPPAELDRALAAEESALETERRAIVRDSYRARRQWRELSARLELVWAEMAKRPESAAYGALRLGLPVDWSRWQGALAEQGRLRQAAGRRVLSVHFAWPRSEADAIQLIGCRNDWESPKAAPVTTSRLSIESFIQQCFGGPGRSTLSTWLRMAGGDAAWCRRFAPLIAPLEEWSAPGDIVLLIPHGPLHSVPLHALYVGGQPLIERNPVCLAPSAGIVGVGWQRRMHRRPGSSDVVVACPDPGSGFPPLPRAGDEGRYVAHLLGVTPLVDDRIDREEFRRSIGDARSIHFSGHATEAESGWDSALQLGGGHQLTARDLFQMTLKAELFALSGCRTARSRRREGDELVGLIPAILYAGAGSVLASLWEASDEATALFMRTFHEALRADPSMCKAAALSEAATRTRRVFPSLQHWAAFTLHGDWK